MNVHTAKARTAAAFLCCCTAGGLCLGWTFFRTDPRHQYLQYVADYAGEDNLAGSWRFSGYFGRGKSIRHPDTFHLSLSSDGTFAAILRIWAFSSFCSGTWRNQGRGKLELTYSAACESPDMKQRFSQVDLHEGENEFIMEDRRLKESSPEVPTSESSGG